MISGARCILGRSRVSQLFAVVLCLLTLGAETRTQDRRVPVSHTYYVDSAHGDDHGSGLSPGLAWKALAKVNSATFVPGDRILFKSGSKWTGQLWPKGSGSAGHPIVIGKYGGTASPIINTAGQAEDAVLLKNQEYWEINDLEVTNWGATSGERRGVNVIAENSGELHHIYLRNLDIHDVNGIDSDKANGGIMYHCIGDSKPSRFVDLRIENNRIHHVDRSGIVGSSTHWVRSKWYPSLGVVIRRNFLDDIGADGIVPVATDGALVEYNVVAHANQRSQGYNDGIWPWSADNTIVQFNEVYGMKGLHDGMGFDADWNSRNTIIQYNYSHDNEGGFLLICNEGSQKAEDSVGNVGTIVRYNISQNDHHRSINLAGPVNNTMIYNNTIYVSRDDDIDLVVQSNWTGWSRNTYLYNNIFYVAGSGKFSHAVSHSDEGVYTTVAGIDPSQNTVFDSNVYFGRIGLPSDPHALTDNPVLLEPGHAGIGRASTRVYALRLGSPAARSGRAIANSGDRDFFGKPVPGCAVDRGAVQLSRSCQ